MFNICMSLERGNPAAVWYVLDFTALGFWQDGHVIKGDESHISQSHGETVRSYGNKPQGGTTVPLECVLWAVTIKLLPSLSRTGGGDPIRKPNLKHKAQAPESVSSQLEPEPQ